MIYLISPKYLELNKASITFIYLTKVETAEYRYQDKKTLHFLGSENDTSIIERLCVIMKWEIRKLEMNDSDFKAVMGAEGYILE